MAHGKIQIQTLTLGYQDGLIPDVFQIIMSNFVQDMEYFETYLDDLLILTNNKVKYHLLMLEMFGSRNTLNHWDENEHLQIFILCRKIIIPGILDHLSRYSTYT
jgi:hypothetical protein